MLAHHSSLLPYAPQFSLEYVLLNAIHLIPCGASGAHEKLNTLHME